MDERILHILSLCLQAKKNGLQIFFKYFPHTNEINVYAHKEFDYSMYPDEIPDYLINECVYMVKDEEIVNENLDKLELKINTLVDERRT